MTSTSSSPGSAFSIENSLSGHQNIKSQRYDRQLRLWGDHGQSALESANVCLINATCVGAETLKSLVLPGIGTFTIVDGNTLESEDVATNFFLDYASIGQNRGVVCARNLLEMNQEVRGHCVEENAEQLLASNPTFFTTFSLVMATDLCERSLITLSKLLWDAKVPLMLIRTLGFLGYIRLQIRECTIIESRPDNHLYDFRLSAPFPQLKHYMEQQDMDNMTKLEHGHTPYLVILYKCLQKWGTPELPKTYAEKRKFKELISQNRFKMSDGNLLEEEENFEEAIRAVNLAITPTPSAPYNLPTNVKEILNDDKCLHLTYDSDIFWIMARALKDFVDNNEGMLPVNGSIPDMFSESKRYIELQSIYREKAQEDAEAIFRIAQKHLELLGRSIEILEEKKVRLFCQNAANIRLIRMSGSIADEYSGHPPLLVESNKTMCIAMYLVLRAADVFRTQYNGWPGHVEDELERDMVHLKQALTQIKNKYGMGATLMEGGDPWREDDLIQEVCHYGGVELPCVASVIGGCAAQEAIKIITNQFVPVDNLFIYNLINSETCCIKV